MASSFANPAFGAVGQVTAARAIPVLGDGGQESLRRLMALEVGKAFAAQVLSRLPGGEFVVGIAGTVAKMALPQGVSVGDQLSLTLVGKEPRPVFLLQQNEDAPAATLSPAARLIDSLLRQDRSDAVPGRAPLLPDAAPAPQAAPLTDALRAAIEHSGLFYESHVAQWAAGERPMEALLREPQMQSARAALAESAPSNTALTVASTIASTAASNPAALAPTTPDATLPAMQLDTLEARRVAWQGELFPGQPLRWEVQAEDEREGANRNAGAVDDARAWRSAIRITLPALGAVEACLALRGNRLQLQVCAAEADAAAQMSGAGVALATALEAAGLRVDGLTVRHERL